MIGGVPMYPEYNQYYYRNNVPNMPYQHYPNYNQNSSYPALTNFNQSYNMRNSIPSQSFPNYGFATRTAYPIAGGSTPFAMGANSFGQMPSATGGILSRIPFLRGVGTGGMNLQSILSTGQKTINTANQILPVINQVRPLYHNVRTMFNVAKAVKSTDFDDDFVDEIDDSEIIIEPTFKSVETEPTLRRNPTLFK